MRVLRGDVLGMDKVRRVYFGQDFEAYERRVFGIFFCAQSIGINFLVSQFLEWRWFLQASGRETFVLL